MSKFYKSGLSLAQATSLFVLKAGDTMTGGLSINTTDGGATTTRLDLISNLFSEYRANNYTNTAGLGTSFSGQRARGTLSAPADVATNDLLLTVSSSGYGGGAFRAAGFFTFRVIAAAPGAGDMQSQWRLFISPPASVSPAETLRADSGGIYAFGANLFLDANRVFRNRLFTVGTLPAGVQGMRTVVTDALAPAFNAAVAGGGAVTIPVFYTGAAWNVG